MVLLSCAMRVDVVCSKPDHRGRTLVCIKNTAKRQRRGGLIRGHNEVTVTSEPHKQKEQINRTEKAVSSGGSVQTKAGAQRMGLNVGGVPR